MLSECEPLRRRPNRGGGGRTRPRTAWTRCWLVDGCGVLTIDWWTDVMDSRLVDVCVVDSLLGDECVCWIY